MVNWCIRNTNLRIENIVRPNETEKMKINKEGEIVVPASLAHNFGFEPGDDVDIEVSRHGILIKPKAETAESIMQWLKNEHGDEMTTLTTHQILQLLK